MPIQRNQAAVEGADKEPIPQDRNPSVNDITAGIGAPSLGHFWIKKPALRAGYGIQCIDLAPGAGRVEGALNDNR